MFTNSFVSATDWNGDGMPDLLCVSAYHKSILVAHGPFQGNEPIALTQEIDFTPKGSVLDFAVADWDRATRSAAARVLPPRAVATKTSTWRSVRRSLGLVERSVFPVCMTAILCFID